MSLDLLSETYLFGNFSLIQRDIDLEETVLTIEKSNKNLEKSLELPGWQWRFFNNFSILLELHDKYVISQPVTFLRFFNILEETISSLMKILNITDLKEHRYSSEKDFFSINSTLILQKIKNKIEVTCSEENLHLEEVTSRIKKLGIISTDYYYDRTTPYDNFKWNPSWSLIVDQSEIKISNVDVYLDNFFFNSNFQYAENMKGDLEVMTSR